MGPNLENPGGRERQDAADDDGCPDADPADLPMHLSNQRHITAAIRKRNFWAAYSAEDHGQVNHVAAEHANRVEDHDCGWSQDRADDDQGSLKTHRLPKREGHEGKGGEGELLDRLPTRSAQTEDDPSTEPIELEPKEKEAKERSEEVASDAHHQITASDHDQYDEKKDQQFA